MPKPPKSELSKVMACLASIKSPARAAAARANGKLGGRPTGSGKKKAGKKAAFGSWWRQKNWLTAKSLKPTILTSPNQWCFKLVQ
jgi:hypothetical protein